MQQFYDKKMNDKLSFYCNETEKLSSHSVFFSISVIIPSVYWSSGSSTGVTGCAFSV